MADWSITTRDHVLLRGDWLGSRSGATVVLLHGGGQTRHSWGRAAQALAEAGFCVLNLDLRGHGDSGWSADGDYSLDVFAADLNEILEMLPERPSLVGASLGGLTSLLAVGEAVSPAARALVLVDIVPQIEPEGVRQIVDFMRSNPEGFASVEEAAATVAVFLPHRQRPADVGGLRKNLRLGGDGRYRWHWDPRLMSGERPVDPLALVQRLEKAAARVEVPTLLIRGARSRVVSAQSVASFRELIPHAQCVDVDGAEHMVAADHNDAFNAPLIDFLLRTASATARA
jgi:pimeloyl-ACP methyl ester carboxylesterase